MRGEREKKPDMNEDSYRDAHGIQMESERNWHNGGTLREESEYNIKKKGDGGH